jgi:hypothetical protein
MSSFLLSNQLVAMNRQQERQKVLDAESRIHVHMVELGVRFEELMILPAHSKEISDSRGRLMMGPLKTEWNLYYNKAWNKMRARGLKIASSARLPIRTVVAPIGTVVASIGTVDAPACDRESDRESDRETTVPIDVVAPIGTVVASIGAVDAPACDRESDRESEEGKGGERRYDQGTGPFHREEFDEYYTSLGCPEVAQQMWDCGIVYTTDQPFEEVVACIPNDTQKIKIDQFGIGCVRWSEDSQQFYHGNLMKSDCQTGAIPDGGWNLDRGVPQFSPFEYGFRKGASQESIDNGVSSVCTNHQVHGWCPLQSQKSEADKAANRKGRQAHKRIYMCMGHTLDN